MILLKPYPHQKNDLPKIFDWPFFFIHYHYYFIWTAIGFPDDVILGL